MIGDLPHSKLIQFFLYLLMIYLCMFIEPLRVYFMVVCCKWVIRVSTMQFWNIRRDVEHLLFFRFVASIMTRNLRLFCNEFLLTASYINLFFTHLQSVYTLVYFLFTLINIITTNCYGITHFVFTRTNACYCIMR